MACKKSCIPPVLHQQQDELSNIGQRPRESGSTSSTLRSTQARSDCLPTAESSVFAVKVVSAGKGWDSAPVNASDGFPLGVAMVKHRDGLWGCAAPINHGCLHHGLALHGHVPASTRKLAGSGTRDLFTHSH